MLAWWDEIKEIEELEKAWKWCCKLFKEGNFEEFIQNEIGIYVGLRLHLNFCPHCGTQMTQTPPKMHWNYCCYLFRDLGFEGMQYEEQVPDCYGGLELHVHRLHFNYCFHCGQDMRKLKKTSKESVWKGVNGCNDDCSGCA